MCARPTPIPRCSVAQGTVSLPVPSLPVRLAPSTACSRACRRTPTILDPPAHPTPNLGHNLRLAPSPSPSVYSSVRWEDGPLDTKHPAQIRCSVPKGSCPFVLGHFCDQWAGAGRGLCPHPQLSTQPASRPSSSPAPAPPRVQLWPRLHTALPSPVPARTVAHSKSLHSTAELRMSPFHADGSRAQLQVDLGLGRAQHCQSRPHTQPV